MADTTVKMPLQTAPAKTSEPTGFGAYGGTVSGRPAINLSPDKQPQSKPGNPLDFTDSDKRWLKDLGITTTDPSTFHRVWESPKETHERAHRKWADSYGGRVAMRAVSRGVVGAAFYAGANLYAGKTMPGYHGDNPNGVLQHIAYFIDKTIGEGVKSATRIITHDENKAVRSVTFRNTVDHGYKIDGKSVMGRSLGHEAVMITFDFASMSFGDYMTRYAFGLMDPNAKKHWTKENGQLDIPGGLKDLLGNMFRGVTYASGEDMAVAIPYVYGMRLQRHFIEKASPGFKFDSDRGLNGGSYKHKLGKIVGDFQAEGMLDLMGRFSWYNVGTKMFRDAYGAVQTKVDEFDDRWKKGDHSPPHISIDPKSFTAANMAKTAAHSVNYVVRTTAKVMGYMIPATAFFFISRSPQSKVRGHAIDIEGKGILSRDKHFGGGTGKGKNKAPGRLMHLVEESVSVDNAFAGRTSVSNLNPGSNYNGRIKDEDLYWYRDGKKYAATEGNPFDTPSRSRKEAFKDTFYEKSPWYSKILNPIGKLCYDFGTGVDHVLGKLTGKYEASLSPEKALRFEKKRETFSRLYANAAIAYTPYFMMKTDILSAAWDTKRTDMAYDRTLSGAVHLNWGEFKAGLGEVRHALLHQPFTDPKREELAQKLRWHSDSEHLSNEAFQLTGVTPRMLRYAEKHDKYKFAREELKSKPIAPATFTQLKTPESWASQEAVRRFQDSDTQGQSIH